ncbi:MAG: hypothetical protein JNN00_08345 [Chitinophagaceae bacterium]|nr:hypothetical protein [Chitinophagaceae bacterium]
MKKYLCLFVLLFAVCSAIAQSGKKKPQKEKPPTQKEMEDMMKEAQKELDALSPEDRKIMEQMGIKLPDMNKMKKDASGATDAQLKKAYEDQMRPVPPRDEARIAAIPAAITTSGVAAYVSSVHTKTLTMLKSASKTMGEKIYAQLKSTGKNADAIGKAAVGLWVMGKVELAVYLLGKSCIDNAANTNNLSNYASMLSMMGAEHLAIPILNNLNARLPGNTTLLNNLGQAWFGLGEVTKAEKYLDSAIRIYKYHPQANFTKSFIEESKDHKTDAVNLVKNAMRHDYSQEREERLRKLGYKLTADDVKLPPKTKADPLNLGGFNHPPYPRSVDECITLEPVWKDYRQQLKDQAAALKQRLETTKQAVENAQEKRMQTDLSMIKASMGKGMPQGQLTPMPLHWRAATLKINEVTGEYQRKIQAFGKKVSDFAMGPGLKLTQEYNKEMARLKKEDADQTGEGLPNKDYCPKYKETSDKYLAAYNSAAEELMNESLEITKNFINDDTYWKLYAEWPENYEATGLGAEMSWLGSLMCDGPLNFKSITDYKCKPPALKKGDKLANFDDVACRYHSELNLVFGKIKTDCSRMTTAIDAPFVKAGLKQDMDKENFSDQFISCTIEATAEVGKEIELGPVNVGASAKGGMGIEIDRTGVKDVYLIGEAGAGAGPANVSIEGRVSLVSGRAEAGVTGPFAGIKL